MKNTDMLKIEMITNALNDWLMTADIVYLIIVEEGVTIKGEEKIKERSIELIGKGLWDNLMIIGNLEREGINPWNLSI
jgi:hypothetical protein